MTNACLPQLLLQPCGPRKYTGMHGAPYLRCESRRGRSSRLAAAEAPAPTLATLQVLRLVATPPTPHSDSVLPAQDPAFPAPSTCPRPVQNQGDYDVAHTLASATSNGYTVQCPMCPLCGKQHREVAAHKPVPMHLFCSAAPAVTEGPMVQHHSRERQTGTCVSSCAAALAATRRLLWQSHLPPAGTSPCSTLHYSTSRCYNTTAQPTAWVLSVCPQHASCCST